MAHAGCACGGAELAHGDKKGAESGQILKKTSDLGYAEMAHAAIQIAVVLKEGFLLVKSLRGLCRPMPCASVPNKCLLFAAGNTPLIY